MPSIVTLTFSPCIDKTTSVDALVPEKKLRCTTPKFEPGGGGINVARAIKKLGGDSIAIYPAGGHTGNYLQSLLLEEEIKTSVVSATHFTRENLIVVDRSINQQYRFGMPGSPLSEPEWKMCLQRIEEVEKVEFIVASGSLPPGVPENIFVQLAQIAKNKSAKLIVDTSGAALRHAAAAGVYLLKPNIGELASLVNKEEVREEDAVSYGKQLLSHGRVQVLVISLGPQGALLITNDQVLELVPPIVKRQSTVGAGDSMVAGIVHQLSQKATIADAVRYGIACGTAATMNPGTELCHLADVEELLPQVKIIHKTVIS